MNAVIVTIGDEILMGQILDTNSKFIAGKLTVSGFEVVEMMSVKDEASAIKEAVERSMERADVVIFTGGLGPTRDDKTKQVLADYFGTRLVHSDEAYEWLLEILAKKSLQMNKLNEGQAVQPENCRLLKNDVGTACGMCFEKRGKLLFALPGVPMEMVFLMENRVMPVIVEHFPDLRLDFTLYKVYGITESDLAIRLESFEDNLPDGIGLAYLPEYGVMKLRLTAHGNAVDFLEEYAHKLEKALDGLKIQHGADKSLPIEVAEMMKSEGKTLATAESCTGGNIAHELTLLPGASEWFMGGVVSYATHVKSSVLGVPSELIEQYGVVSGEVARAMAEGVRKVTGSDYGIATTGVAGPTGGDEVNPVGTVWIAVATPEKCNAKCFHFSTNRERNISKATNAALMMLLKR